MLKLENIRNATGASVTSAIATTTAPPATWRRDNGPNRRRAGDPARLVASNVLAGKELGWRPERGLEEIISTAWRWHSQHPSGYNARPRGAS